MFLRRLSLFIHRKWLIYVYKQQKALLKCQNKILERRNNCQMQHDRESHSQIGNADSLLQSHAVGDWMPFTVEISRHDFPDGDSFHLRRREFHIRHIHALFHQEAHDATLLVDVLHN